MCWLQGKHKMHTLFALERLVLICTEAFGFRSIDMFYRPLRNCAHFRAVQTLTGYVWFVFLFFLNTS